MAGLGGVLRLLAMLFGGVENWIGRRTCYRQIVEFCRMERNLAPNQRANPGFDSRFMKPRSPVNSVAVAKRQGRITQPRSPSRQVLGLRSPVKKTKPGGGLEFDVHGNSDEQAIALPYLYFYVKMYI